MRVVIDTDVMVAAVRSRMGASRRLLAAALNRRFEMAISTSLLLEYESVLKRPEHLLASGLSTTDVDVLLESVAIVGIPATRSYIWRLQMHDPNDELVLETAIGGFADMIVTFNLIHFRMPAARFGISAVRPFHAIALIGG